MARGLSPRLAQLRERLIEAARHRGFVYYKEVAQRLDIVSDRLDHSREMANALDEISIYEHENGRPLLSVVVVHQDDKRPGQGFFKMAKHTGVQEPATDNDAFYVHELTRAWDYWENAEVPDPQ